MTETAKITSAFRLTSLASVLCIAFSALTTKIIAVTLGPAGVGLMGLYRTLGSFVGRALQLGFDTVLTQRLSTAVTAKEKAGLVEATLLLLFLEAICLLVIASLLDSQISKWLMGPEGVAHVIEIRLIFLMALLNTALQFALAIISGSIKYKHVVLVNLATAGSSLLLIYPLLELGQLGLAINVGSGALAGLALAGALIIHEHGPRLSPRSLAAQWPLLKSTLQQSKFMLLHPTLVAGSTLVAQSLIARHYGIDALGEYTAAITITETATLILMSSVRSHIFPALGQFSDLALKQQFFYKSTSMLVCSSAVASVIIIVLAPYLPSILFSSDFVRATEFIVVLSITVLAQSFLYPMNAFLMHKASYGWALVLDSIWALLMLSGLYFSAYGNDGLMTFVWFSAVAYSLSAGMYWIVITYLYGASYLPISFVMKCVGLLVLMFVSAFLTTTYPGAPAGLAMVMLCGVAITMWSHVKRQ